MKTWLKMFSDEFQEKIPYHDNGGAYKENWSSIWPWCCLVNVALAVPNLSSKQIPFLDLWAWKQYNIEMSFLTVIRKERRDIMNLICGRDPSPRVKWDLTLWSMRKRVIAYDPL